MKLDRMGIFFVTLALLPALPAFAAQDRVGKVDLGGYAAGAFPDTGAEDDLWAGANTSYGLYPWLAIGVDGGWQDAAMGNIDSHLGVVAIMGDIILRSPIFWESTVFYGVGGLGVIAAWVEDEFGFYPLDSGDDVDDVGFGAKLGVGVDWFMTDNWVLNLEFDYYHSGDIELTGTALAREDISFGTVGGGIKYVF